MTTPEPPVSALPRVASTMNSPEVTVIVATIDAARSIDDCLRSVQGSLAGIQSELIVVDASSDSTPDIVQRSHSGITMIRKSAGTLTPRLWAAGLQHACGRHVAFMTGHSTVGAGWSQALSDALETGAAGAGGPISLSKQASLTDSAIYFLRYSAFMPTAHATPYAANEIAGDNSMYSGEILRRHIASFNDGFWEVPFHRIIRAEGAVLSMVPAAAMEFGRSFGLGTISTQRFAHGRHFGKWRVAESHMGKLRIIAGAPIVPFVLMARIGRRVLRARTVPLGRFLAASPLILWLGVCWALGEAMGALDA